MPKGKPEKVAAPPAIVLCDFCGCRFAPSHWQSRTCPVCKTAGAPCQSENGYDDALVIYQRAKGLANKKPTKADKERASVTGSQVSRAL